MRHRAFHLIAMYISKYTIKISFMYNNQIHCIHTVDEPRLYINLHLVSLGNQAGLFQSRWYHRLPPAV